MNKDEILSKAQKERKILDEREEQIELKAYEKGFHGALIACALLQLTTILLTDRIGVEFYLIYFWAQAFHYGYKAWKLRNKSDIIHAVLFVVFSLILTYAFLYSTYTSYLIGR